MNKKRKAYIQSCEISEIQTAKLGGYVQKFAIEGKSKALPVVICLHGGPGSPIPFSVGCRGLFPGFSDKFVMVYWDQLGCGINNRIIDDSFTVAHFVNMTVDLVREIRRQFPENKIFLFGMSWGSILALCSAVLVPELLDGVITCGQVIKAPMLSDSAFEAVETSNAPEKSKKLAMEWKARRTALSLKEMMALSKIIRKYTDGYNNSNAKAAPVGDIIKGLLTSPDYRLKDFIAIVKNGYRKNQSLLREMASADLSGELARVRIPYHIFQGETDIVTCTADVVTAVTGLHNQNITCTVIPNTGHFPTESAMEQISAELSRRSC